RISIERGHDPRRFTLVAFGGAGPLHAAELARALGIQAVLVPEYPGVLSALGLLVSDLRTEFAVTRIVETRTLSRRSLDTLFHPLEQEAAAWLDREHVPLRQRQLTRAVDMRYVGQNHELTVPCPRIAGRDRLEALETRFAALHRRVYGHGDRA